MSWSYQIGDVIERRQVAQFGDDIWTPYLIVAVRGDSFLARPLREVPTHQPMGFLFEMRGQTWR